jgi:hypothetical protein
MNATLETCDLLPRNGARPSDTRQGRLAIEPQDSSPEEAPRVNGRARQKCFVCDREIVDGPWFCKVPCEGKPIVVLCCPWCALRYFNSPHPAAIGEEQDRANYEQSLPFLVDAEKP